MTTCAQRVKDALNDGKCQKCERLEQSNMAMRVQISSLEDDNENLRAERLRLQALAYPVRSA